MHAANFQPSRRAHSEQGLALLQVSLHAPEAGSSSFLPHWLAFPIGLSTPHKLPLPQYTGRTGLEPQRHDMEGLPAQESSSGLAEVAFQGLPSAPAQLSRRSLGDAGMAPTTLQPPSPLLRSRSEVVSSLIAASVPQLLNSSLHRWFLIVYLQAQSLVCEAEALIPTRIQI